MKNKKMTIHLVSIIAFICISYTANFCQDRLLSVSQAVSIAEKNYDGLERGRLEVKQKQILSEGGVPMPFTQLSLSGEEFGAGEYPGIYSINAQQSFYLPKVSRTHNDYYKKGAELAKLNLKLSEQELKWNVEQAYLQLLYAKEEQALIDDLIKLYDNFLSTVNSKIESGETGKIPQLATISQLRQITLEKDKIVNQHRVAKEVFNQWLQSDTVFYVEGNLTLPEVTPNDTSVFMSIHIQAARANQEIARAVVEKEKAKLLPQINIGLKLQTISGDFPLFGYQVGVNVPLFKKGYDHRIEAAEVEVKAQEADVRTRHHKLTMKISKIKYEIQHQIKSLDYLNKELIPVVIEQKDLISKAYLEGETSYLELLRSLEQEVDVKRQILFALYRINALKIELDYWISG